MYSRPLAELDRPNLEASLVRDEYHQDTEAEFFYDPRSMCNAYEDEEGTIFWVRGTKALRLDIQFKDNSDFKRNRQALLEGFPPFIENARRAGFTELVFNSSSPLLIAFCKKHFEFVESQGEMRRFI